MPIRVQNDLPVKEILEKENIFVMDEHRAMHQDIRPIKIGLLNLMPLKEDTELQILRSLSNTPLQVDVSFVTVSSHQSKNTPTSHLNKFYQKFSEIKDQKFDGFIITGAPVEQMPFEEVDYWDEVTEIFDWARTHVTSTLYICWAAQAGLYHFYGVPKYKLGKKMFGVFKHKVNDVQNPIFRGFDDEFYVPHSRHTEVRAEDIRRIRELSIVSESEESGVYMVMARGGRGFFITGHSEYSPYTLDGEYRRDVSKGLDIDLPKNYYRDNNPEKGPVVRWRGHANLLFSNWLNYFVYQQTPYDIREIK